MTELLKSALLVAIVGTILLVPVIVVVLTKYETNVASLVFVLGLAIAIVLAASTGRGVSVRRRELDGGETSAHIGSEEAKP